MNVLEKLLLFIMSIIVGAIGVFIFVIASPLSEIVYENLSVEIPLELFHIEITVYVIAGIVVLRALQLFSRSIRMDKRTSQSVDKKTELGEIQISMETLESLSLKAVSRMKGIHDVKSSVRSSDTGLILKLRCLVDGDLAIPQLSVEMQKAVKEHVESIAGIPVHQVVVRIANIQKAQASKSRLD